MENVDNKTIKDVINNSNKLLLVTRERPSVDGICALLALAVALKQRQKTVTLATSGQLPEEVKGLPGVEEIQSEVKSHNLMLSFDYVEGSVEKVSYSIEGDKFNLLLTGRDSSLDPKKIQFSNLGPDYDLIIYIDTPKKDYVGQLFAEDAESYDNIPGLNLDYHNSNSRYGTYNWVPEDTVSTSEVVFDIIISLEFGIDKSTAQLLLTGIKAATSNFGKDLRPETLEKAAACLRVIGDTQENSKAEEPPVTPDESWFAPKIYRSSKIIE